MKTLAFAAGVVVGVKIVQWFRVPTVIRGVHFPHAVTVTDGRDLVFENCKFTSGPRL